MSHGYLPANMADGDLARTLWKLRVPLLVTHAALPAGTPPFVATVPRFSYLAQLLPRLRAYYGPGPELPAAPSTTRRCSCATCPSACSPTCTARTTVGGWLWVAARVARG